MKVVGDKSTPLTSVDVDGDLLATRKLNHNASERNRRKKINLLFSSLRSVLPLRDQKKRLSNPATVSQALKYIPNLQKQVQELVEKKKQLSDKAGGSSWPLLSVSSNRLSDSEVVVQISTFLGIPLSCILLALKEHGLHPLNISSSLSPGGRIFFNLHLHDEKQGRLIEYRILNERVMRLYKSIDYV